MPPGASPHSETKKLPAMPPVSSPKAMPDMPPDAPPHSETKKLRLEKEKMEKKRIEESTKRRLASQLKVQKRTLDQERLEEMNARSKQPNETHAQAKARQQVRFLILLTD
jgi:hypothetical protein